MKRSKTTVLAPVISLLIAALLFAHMQQHASGADTEPYHARVRAAVDSLPLRFAGWVGEEIPIPPAAGQLLRPNAILSRQYNNLERGTWASLVVVHCRDPRDMAGHYPPNCYPGTGWMQRGEPGQVECAVDDRVVPLAEYRFSRTEHHRIANRIVYNLFVLPHAGIATDMRAVQRATGDYQNRPFGAAQIQIIVDSSTPSAERSRILEDMMQVLAPVIEALKLQEEGTGS